METMKIAVVTDDGETITSHFGMAGLYRVFTIENGKVVTDDTRSKPHHAVHPDHLDVAHAMQHNHDDMLAPIRDCQVMLCGGMGSPAYQKAVNTGLEVILTGGRISDAVQSYLSGTLNSDSHRIHQH